MSIYTSEQIRPYVYILTNKIDNTFYIGSRYSNTLQQPSHIDITKYQSSSKIIKQLGFDNFNYIILAEFFDGNSAYDFEQQLIYEHWDNPLLLNQSCFYNKKRFKYSPLGTNHRPDRFYPCGFKHKTPMTDEHKSKLSQARKGILTGPNPLKARHGKDNGIYGRKRTAQEKLKMSQTRAERTNEQNKKSYSRVKSLEEIAKLKLPRPRVCRIKDRKEMSIANFFKYLKLKPHLYF